MTYAVIDDVWKRYKPVQSIIGNTKTDISSSEVASIYIADAESFVDAYLARRYVVPLNPVPPLITQVTADLAIFNMLVEKQPDFEDFFQARYDRSMKTLENLRDGTMEITSQTLVTTGDNEAWSDGQDYHPTFSPVLDPIDQAVDGDWVDADKDERADD
jgi:phage gp36-like protein